jgi:hypothetical protein
MGTRTRPGGIKRPPGLLLALLAPMSLALLACGEVDRPATFEYIHAAVIAPNCATSGCHSDLAEVGGINLQSFDDAYLELTGRRCDQDDAPAQRYVVGGQPERSQLMYLLLGLEAVRPMPPDLPLPAGDIDLIEAWILEGAPCR